MENKKTKSLLMVICGGILIGWSAFSFLSGSIKWIIELIRCKFYIPFSNYLHVLPLAILVAIGVFFFLKRKDWIVAGLVGALYLTDCLSFIRMLPSAFRWNVGYGLLSVLANLLACGSTLVLVGVIVLALLRPNNIISKFLWIASPVLYFGSFCTSVLNTLIQGWFSMSTVGYIFESLIFCVVLAALGFTLQMQTDEPTTEIIGEAIEVTDEITNEENNEEQ